MTGKHTFARRLLALILCAALVVPMGTSGLAGILSSELWSSLVPTAHAETIEVNSIETLRAAITSANNAGTSVQTVIKLTGGWSGEFVDALPAITGNVVLDLNGQTVSYKAYGSGKLQDNSNFQIPNQNRNNSVQSDTLAGALFTVNSGATLQIINSSASEGKIVLATKFDLTNNWAAFDYNHRTIQTSSSLINCAGTLIMGDHNKDNNNFVLHTSAHSVIT
ncbi:MAG: hypothetical protein IKM24_08270, partial [Clostridia bacterium]|nr:hypothetical protein [Clostridia bacterium]